MKSAPVEQPLVADSSLTIAWLLADEITDDIKRVYVQAARVGLAVPAIWRFEVLSALNAALLGKRISLNDRNDYLSDLALLEIVVDPESQSRAWEGTAALSDKHRLTPYDAAYLELAIRSGYALASLDNELRAAAEKEGIDVLPAKLRKGR